MENVKLEFVKEDGDRKIRDSNGTTIMCDMQYYPWIDADDSYWRLWAAAPELLRKLKELVDACDGNYRELTEECNAAITKAEGRS